MYSCFYAPGFSRTVVKCINLTQVINKQRPNKLLFDACFLELFHVYLRHCSSKVGPLRTIYYTLCSSGYYYMELAFVIYSYSPQHIFLDPVK